jgi:hypothetical protein
MTALRDAEQSIDSAKARRAIWFELVERAGRRETFQHALVDRARIDAAGEIAEIGERPVASPRNSDSLSVSFMSSVIDAARNSAG